MAAYLYHMMRHFSSLIVVVVLLLAGGCSRSPAPDYDRLNVLLLRELFRALSDGEYSLAIRKLDRLADAMPDAPNIHVLQRRQIDNIAIARANQQIHEGDYAQALASLREARLEHGSSDQLDLAIEGMEKVLKVQEYIEDGVPDDPRRLAIAVDELPSEQIFNRAREPYTAWLSAQRRLAANRLGDEKQELIRRTMEDLDLALVAGSTTADDLLKRLSALAPGSTIVAVARSSGKADAIRLALRESQDVKAREIAIFLVVYQKGQVEKEGLTEALTEALALPARTRCGHYLRTHALLANGQTLSGLASLRRLEARAPDADLKPLQQLLPSVGEGREAVSVPGVIDMLRKLLK